MAGSSGFSISITAKDQTSGTLDSLNKRLARLNAPAERFNKALNKFGDVSGISRVTEGFGSLGREALNAFSAIDRSASAMASLTSMASLGGMAALAIRFAQTGAAIGRTAYALDLPIAKYTQLTGAAKRYGASVDAVRSSLNAVHEEIYKSIYNKDQTSIANLAMLHINPGTKENPANDLDVLKQIADRVAATKDIHGKENILDMNGIDRAMLPMMNEGSKGIEKAMARTDFLGGTITKEMAENATKMQGALSDLSTVIGGSANRLGSALDSWLAGPLLKIDDWLAEHPGLVDKAGPTAAVAGALIGPSVAKAGISWLWNGGPLAAAAGPLGAIVAGAGLTAAAISAGANSADELTSGKWTLQDIAMDKQRQARARALNPTKKWSLRASLMDRSGGSTNSLSDPIKRGFLDTIAGPESGGRYDVKNGGSRFSGLGIFPEGIGPGGTSTASGRYQFLSSTWHEEQGRLSLPDFGPQSQDAAAWDLADRTYRDKTGRDLLGDLKSGGNGMRIAGALNDVWPSLPGGSQSKESLSDFHDALGRNTGGEVNVNVRFQNAPPGMRADVQTTGNVKAPPPGVGTTLPFAH